MLIPQKEEVISRSPDLDLTAANFPAQTKRITLPRNAPIEAIYIIVQVTTAALTGLLGHGLLNILKRVTLNINDGTGAYDAVYSSGPGLLILQDLEGCSLDRSTAAAVHASLMNNTQPTQNPAIPSGSIFRIVYPILCPHPSLTDWIRLRSCIPVHRHVQDPILTMDFAAAAELSGVADPFSAANLEVVVIRRDMPGELDDMLIKSGGYIRWDIRESAYDVPASTSNVEKRFAIPSPGEYASLAISMLRGAAALTPGDISASTTVGSETLWRLEAAGNAIRQWRMKHRQMLNDFNRPINLPFVFNPFADQINSITNLGVTGGAPPVLVTAKAVGGPVHFGGALAAGLTVQNPATMGFDFLSDNWSGASELGSCLNANFPSDSIKWELVGAITTPANQSSQFNLYGRRFRDDISRWKRVPIVQ